MKEQFNTRIAADLNLSEAQVRATADLLEQGATVPFIARYRKEATQNLDEVQIIDIRDALHRLEELEARREAVLASLEKNGHLTDELKESVLGAETLAALEDIYLPYRPKRRTKAQIAREKGLEPLALAIFEQKGVDPGVAAGEYVDPEKEVPDTETALSGARDIISEMVSEDAKAREKMRALFQEKAVVYSRVATGKEAEGAKYRDYFEWSEPAADAPSHRILAMRRGEKEDILNLTLLPPEEEALGILSGLFVAGDGPDSAFVADLLPNAYKRFLGRSLETEMRLLTKERADADAIAVFCDNLRHLLLAAPLGEKRVMGVDPGFRTGCKIACLDEQGKLLGHETIQPHGSEAAAVAAVASVKRLLKDHKIQAVAIGNGTAGRETESFFRGIDGLKDVIICMVSESGASVYSASKIAREEFPELDLTVRGAISIARRLLDPLSELVKIDPKSIGVGQYQHDVDQTALKQALDDVVMSCVNSVGVDLNRASEKLLTYVSGLGPSLARNIVAFRDDNGPFPSRDALLSVPRLGPKAFEQAAGFLRIPGGDNPLDSSAVHPESYEIVETMAKDVGCTVKALMDAPSHRGKIRIENYVTEDKGLPTLKDILEELEKPGRDPRERFDAFSFSRDVTEMKDLMAGMRLPGVVTNVTAFGAFVDIGVHQDGLVHISQLADRFVKDPKEIVTVGRKVSVTVLEVDMDRKRIALSMKSGAKAEPGEKKQKAMEGRPRPKKAAKPGKGGKGGSSGPGPKKGGSANTPFNNPFADLLKR